ncbi:hypothetical protein HWV62_12518 [Athelia sp. TMB]|nr:hypothetical protein HWV62_12518 [Athelia sp. TMB]
MICILLLVRLYAIYARSRLILVSFILMGIVMAGLASFSFVNQQSQPLEGFPGCTLAHTTENAIRLAIPWECMLFYDTVVLVLTVMRTYTTANDLTVARRATTAVHVPSLILRDGALYFAGMALSNALNILCFYVTPNGRDPRLENGAQPPERRNRGPRGLAPSQSHANSYLESPLTLLQSWSMSQSFSHPNFRANPEIELDSIKAAAPGPVRVWRADSELDSRGAVIDISNSMHVDEERDAAYC